MKSPAKIVIGIFGGIRPTARELSVAPSAVHRWKKRGLIPQAHHKALLSISRRRRLGLKPTDLIFGRE